MFDTNSKPTLTNIRIPANKIAGIIEKRDGNIALLSSDAVIHSIDLNGNILESKQLFNDTDIINFVEYSDEYWITTSDRYLHILQPDLSIKESFLLEQNAVSVAPLADRSGMIISYFDESNQKSSFEYRSLPDLKVLATGFYGPDLPVISSVAFGYQDSLFLACCSKSELSLLKVENEEICGVQHCSGRAEGMEFNYSQLLSDSKRFLIDNMTGRVKPDLSPSKYMDRLCFFRNEEATHGAVAKRDNWVAFLNPTVLKLVNYDTKQSYKFPTKYQRPSSVKVLKYHVVCAYTDQVTIFDFRSPSIHFITSP